MYFVGKITSFKIKGIKENKLKKNNIHNGIKPILKDIVTRINTPNKFGTS
jgi:hypothetical protein